MKKILDYEIFNRMLKRIAHEIVENNKHLEDVILIGIKNKGLPIAEILADLIYSFEQIKLPVLAIDITKHRDDIKKNLEAKIEFNYNIEISSMSEDEVELNISLLD